MARDHARIHLSIWDDADFLELPALAQRAYLALCSQRGLSYAGVMDWWPNRLAKLASDTTEPDIFEHVKHLIETRFVVLDVETSELLVRTYVKHDHVLFRPNMGKACATAFDRVASRELKEVLVTELATLLRDEPDLKGFGGIKDGNPALWKRIESRLATLPEMG